MDKNPLEQIGLDYKKVTDLTEKEIKVIEYRHGLADNNKHTLEDTGKMFGVTRERIRQIEAKVFEKIRRHLNPPSNPMTLGGGNNK